MGNNYHQLNSDHEVNIFELSRLNLDPKPISFPIYATDPAQTIPMPIESTSKKARTSYLSIENVSTSKTYDNQKQLNKLKSMVKQGKKSSQFKVASNEIIGKYNNKLIKDIDQPLSFNQNILNQHYQEKLQPYLIKLQQLPFAGHDMPNTWIYIGQWFENYPHGIGKIYHISFKYEGYINRGIPHLKGRIMTVDQIYQGQLSMNKRQGFGRLLTKTGYYFEGDWKDNTRIGEGYQIHKDGCVFQGHYKDNKVLKGSFYFPKPQVKKKLNIIENCNYLNLIRSQFKSKYQGDYVDNKFQGKGEYIWCDGRSYQGDWKQGKMNGQGLFTWPNGKRYEGSYINNQKSGFGKFHSEAKTYQGYWQKGKPNGKGKIIKGDVVLYKLWFDGKMIKQDLQAEAFSLLGQELQKFPNQDQSQTYDYKMYQP